MDGHQGTQQRIQYWELAFRSTRDGMQPIYSRGLGVQVGSILLRSEGSDVVPRATRPAAIADADGALDATTNVQLDMEVRGSYTQYLVFLGVGVAVAASSPVVSS